MKKIFILPILLVLVLFSCEKVIDVDVPSIEPKLVVDATFEVFFNETPVTADTNVKLTLTSDFFEEEIKGVTNASVFVTNLSDNTIINYSNVDIEGNYLPDTNFIPEDNVTYELSIIYNNETYKSVASKIKSSPITNIEQTSRTFFVDEVLELKVSFVDIVNEDNFYLFDFSDSSFSLIEDRLFVDGEELTISEFYDDEDLELPSTIDIKLSGISKKYFTYFNILTNQAAAGGGGPFETIPSTLLGNVINTTEDANFPLGYFHISETEIIPVTLEEIEN
jgi:hypothetical protein